MWDYIIPDEQGDMDCSEFSAADAKLLRDSFREVTSTPLFVNEYIGFIQTGARFGGSLH